MGKLPFDPTRNPLFPGPFRVKLSCGASPQPPEEVIEDLPHIARILGLPVEVSVNDVFLIVDPSDDIPSVVKRWREGRDRHLARRTASTVKESLDVAAPPAVPPTAGCGVLARFSNADKQATPRRVAVFADSLSPVPGAPPVVELGLLAEFQKAREMPVPQARACVHGRWTCEMCQWAGGFPRELIEAGAGAYLGAEPGTGKP